MKILGLALVALLLLAFGACIFVVHDDGEGWSMSSGTGVSSEPGSGVSARDVRGVPDFERIDLRCSADVSVKMGSPAEVAVITDDNLLGHVTTEVEDGVLVIGMKKGTRHFHVRPKVEIVVPRLSGLTIAGSGDVVLKDLSGDAFTIAVLGSGDVRASGSVDRLDASVSGSGDLRLFDLKAREVHVSIAGGGDVNVNAGERLAATVAGSGDIRYRGSPKELSRSISGSGSIERAPE